MYVITISVRSKVITLSDNNFEHDTQAASGATTGDWLVLFNKNNFEQIITENLMITLADMFASEINIAVVELETNAKLAKRFDLDGADRQTVLLFKQGYMYEYALGETESVGGIAFFMKEAYNDVEGKNVPLDGTVVSAWKTRFESVWVVVEEAPAAAACLFAGGVVCALLLLAFSRKTNKPKQK